MASIFQMPRKRKFRLTTGKRYHYNKYKKPNPATNSTNEEIPHYNWNQNIPEFFTFADNHETEDNAQRSENAQISDQFHTVMDKVREAGQESFFVTFLTLILNDNFPFESIAFILFSEYVTWLSLASTTTMRYSETSKEFWWAGMKMFGGRFVRFMQGFKHKGSIVNGTATRGNFDPRQTKINFAVPSESVLTNFSPIESLRDIKGEIDPGVCSAILQLCSQQSDNRSHILAFDGKKIVPNSAPIDLLGCEDAETLQQNESIRKDSQYVNKLQGLIEMLENSSVQQLCEIPSDSATIIKENLLDVFRHIGRRIQLLRSIKRKKEYALEKLQNRTEIATKEQFLMNYLKTFVLQCSLVQEKVIDTLNQLCLIITILNGTCNQFCKGENVKLRECENFAELLPPETMEEVYIDKDGDVPSKYIKQRSEEWFAIRKNMKVTGSTVGQALGLNSLKEKKEFVKKLLDGKGNEIPPNEAMQYGSANEINAVATMVGKIMPVLFPDLTFCEEGVYKVYDKKDGTPFMVVSPDGSLRRSAGGLVDIHSNPPLSIEIVPVFIYTRDSSVF